MKPADSDTTEPKPPGWAASLKAGLTEASMLTLLGPILLAFLQIGLCCLLVNERTLSQMNENTWVSNPVDWDARTTVRALQVKYGTQHHPMVVITGDSQILENLEDPMKIPAQLREQGLDVDYAFLATDGQTLWETVQVLDQLPPDFHGAVVLMINPMNLTHGEKRLNNLLEHPRMALDSDNYREEIRLAGKEPRKKTGVFFLDYGQFFAARVTMMTFWFRGREPPNPHYSTERLFSRWDEAQWKKYMGALPILVQLENLDHMAGVLERCIARLKKRGIQVVLVEGAFHPNAFKSFGEKGERYRKCIQELTQRQHVLDWDLYDEAQLKPEDFFDFAHLDNDAARGRYQQALCRHLVELFKNTQDKQP